ncbi:hypothetical protein [Pseudomonas sp. G166]|uniref:hypothetical protein n=1 Tax=Pseudomonas sp. G166 TaxID=3094846 RepID=UPI0030CCD217
MKICDQCTSLILDDNAACPRCAEEMRHTVEALAPRSQPSKAPKILKWLLIGFVVAVLAAVAAVIWILHSLGPMPSFG